MARKPVKAKEGGEFVDTDVPLSKRIQEELLALLCYDRKHGSRVAAIVNADTFDGVHRNVAQGVFKYRKQYGRPPGRRHTKQVIDWLTLSPEQRKTASVIFAKIVEARDTNKNKDFTVDSARTFKLNQQAKAGLDQATELFLSKRGSIYGVLNIMAKASRIPPQVEMGGINLADPKQSLSYLDKDRSGYVLGIRPIDNHGVRLRPGTLTLYLGVKGSGKSWFCTQVARSGSDQGANVLHVTLEMNEGEVAKRYHQAYLHLAERPTRYQTAKLTLNDRNQAVSWDMVEERTKGTPNELFEDVTGITVAHPMYKEYIKRQHNIWKQEWSRIRIVEFPTSTLTIEELDTYLDYLANSEGYAPNIIIIDYPDLMKLDADRYRLDLGIIYKELRGIGIRRKAAIVAPTQINREGMEAKIVLGHNVAEDVSKLHTSDNVFTYSQTQTELFAGLARLRLLYARNVKVPFEVVLSQNYTLGQYVTEARHMGQPYKDKIYAKPGKAKPEGFDLSAKRKR